MKKVLSVLAVLVLFVFLAGNLRDSERVPLNEKLPDKPSFNISNDYDGHWNGRRVDISGDNICLETRIVGTIENGNVSFRLTYNNTFLKGWISDSGKLELYADSQQWGYRFTGTANSNRIDGEWKVTNAPCHGTWYIEKTAS